MRPLMIVVGLGTWLAAGPALASDADWDICEGGGGETQIAACTRLTEDSSLAAENRAAAYYARANAYAGRGDFPKAIADYDSAIKLDANNSWYAASRCWAYTENGEADRGIADCDAAIRLRPNNALAYSNRGAAKEAKGLPDEAMADYKAALAITAETDDDRVGQDDARQALDRLQKK
jgi:tetratricopeptide (TPR) repeat protein